MTDEQLSEVIWLCDPATAVSDRIGFCPECSYVADASPEPIWWTGLCPDCHKLRLLRDFKRLFPVLLDAYQRVEAERDRIAETARRSLATMTTWRDALRAERDQLRDAFRDLVERRD